LDCNSVIVGIPEATRYHPHHHGSTALQAGGGAAGIIIVEDTDDFGVPNVIRTAPEFTLLMQSVNLDELSEIAAESGSNLRFPATPANLLLVNGQTAPKITIRPNTWVRLRMGMASIEQYISAAFDVAGCELQLIAKDGVYLHSLPRTIQRITICQGMCTSVHV
jgi:FtsP/CotA-like multicopper oxidase with cupredoxin domain